MVAGCLQWVHPHAIVGALRLGVFVFAVVIRANRKWCGSEQNLLVFLSIVLLYRISEIFDQVGQDSISFAFWQAARHLAARVVFVVEVDAVEVVLVDVVENTLNLVFRHSTTREWEGGTADAQDHLHVWIFFFQFLHTKFQSLWIWSRELEAETVCIVGVVLFRRACKREEDLVNVCRHFGQIAINIRPPNAVGAP